MTDPEKTVKDYLAKQGYPLEMFVASEFRKAGFEVYQSSMYTDKNSGKSREIDVTAYFTRHVSGIEFNFKIIIECKFAKNIWIFFSGENKGFYELKVPDFYCSNYAGKKMLNRLSELDGFNNNLWFILTKKLGYGLTEVTTVQDDNQNEGRTTFKAISTLINSLQYEREIDTIEKGKIIDIFIPIIVIQGKLFESYISNNDVKVNEIQEGQLVYKSNVYPGVYPIINVITREKVGSLVEKIHKDLTLITEGYIKDILPFLEVFPINPEYFIG